MPCHLRFVVNFMIVILSSAIYSWGQAAPPNRGNTSRPAPAPERQSDQVANLPYFTLRDGLSSTLTLNNNAPTPTTVTVTIFNTEGRAQTLDPITLDPHLFKQIELRDVVKSDDFDEGNVSIAFYGTEMDVTTQVSVYSLEKHIAFESREQGMMDFESTISNGILYLPRREAQGFLAMTNVSKTKVTIQLSVGSKKKEIVLYSRETRLVKLNGDLDKDDSDKAPSQGDSHAQTSSLIKLQQSGVPGDVIMQGFVLGQGYASSFTMVDSKVMRSSHLAGAHFRFGRPDPREGFPAGTSFTSPLLLANVSDKPVTAHVSVDYTVTEKLAMTPIDPKQGGSQDKFTDVLVRDVTIDPGNIQQIELADELSKLGVPTPVKESGVDIDYQAPPGSLIGHLVSVDQNGTHPFEVPIKDAFAWNAMVEGIYPWTLENGERTILHLKNRTDKPVNAWTTITFPGGAYTFPLLSFKPYQTIAIDIQDLKDSQKADSRGKPFPADATHGQIIWFPKTPYTLVGRAERTNLSEGIAHSFSCSVDCCNNFQEYACTSTGACAPSILGGGAVIPVSGLTDEVGGSGQLTSYLFGTDCQSNPFGPTAASAQSWSSDDTSVATVDGSGKVSYVGAGSTNISASIDDYGWTWGTGGPCQCVDVPQTYTSQFALDPQINQQAPVRANLTPDHVRVVSDDQNYPDCPPPLIGPSVYVRQMVMQLVNVNNMTVAVNYSNQETFTAESTNSCGNGNAVPSNACVATGPTPFCTTCGPGQWRDTMAVAGPDLRAVCNSGINRASDCGYTLTSSWNMCSNGFSNVVWNSTRETRSDRALVNNLAAGYLRGTQLY